MKILVCDPVGESGITYLREQGYDILLRTAITLQELSGAVSDVDALVIRGRTKVTKDVLDKAVKLKVIARSGSGVDTIDCVEAKRRGIVVVNAPGANSESVAEHTFGLILALSRNLVHTVNVLKSGIWSKQQFRGMELMGKTLGVVGFGHIGKRVADIGAAFGMQVLVYSKTSRNHADSQNSIRFAAFNELLKTSDVVTVHVPLTDETRNMIDAKALARMKKSAFFINTSRGGVVDEPSLVTALQNGIIAGAGLDVFATEPLSSKSPLLELSNVVLTPHVGANSPEAENRASLTVAQDIHRVLTGQEPLHGVAV